MNICLNSVAQFTFQLNFRAKLYVQAIKDEYLSCTKYVFRDSRGNASLSLFPVIFKPKEKKRSNPVMASANVVRPVANFPPRLWGDFFSSFVEDKEVSEKYANEVHKLKEDVRNMLMSRENTTIDQIILIDTIERLGVSYHFEKEIDEQLQQIFDSKANFGDENLFTVALQFRLLRQHGHRMSCSVFEKFKDTNGSFKEELKSDIKGLLSLYEAAHLRIIGEEILEDALIFTKTHLKLWVQNSSSSLMKKQVEHALVQSLQRGIPRFDARHFISIYEEDDSKNEILLRLAKLDFNLLQILYRKELVDLSRWWKEMDLMSKLSYPRDKLVECYILSVGTYCEPQYALGRIMFTKFMAIHVVIDDTYDSYGTLEELEVFTDAVQRWNISEIDRLPDYMKIIYKALLDLFEEFEEILRGEGRSYAVNYAKETAKQLMRSYYTEAKWFIKGDFPTFAEYTSYDALITAGLYMMVSASYMGMKAATKDAFNWLLKKPKIVTCGSIIARLNNDISSYKGKITIGVECYKKDHGIVSMEDIFDKFLEIVENAWKDVNEECFKPTPIPWEILVRDVNLTRLADVFYKNNQDGFTHTEELLKQKFNSLLIDPITI